MSLIYLAALLVSLGGMLLLDWRHRLFLWRRPGPAILTLLAGTALLIATDLVAISLGLFRMGDSPLMTGVTLAPHLPIEEPIFLLLLCQLTMVLHEVSRRWLRRRQGELALGGAGQGAPSQGASGEARHG